MIFSAAISFENTVEDAESFVVRFKQHGASPITEKDTGTTVAVVGDRAHLIRSYHYHFFITTTFYKAGAGGQTIQKTRTGRCQIKAPGIFCTDFITNKIGGRGKEHIWRDCSHNEAVDFFRAEPSFFTELQHSGGTKIRSAL